MLTQNEADFLLNMHKLLTDNGIVNFPKTGEAKSLDLISEDGKEKFIIDINRKSTIKIKKCTYQKRYRTYIILLRLDIEGSPHTNPDGEVILGAHFHIYKEGFGDAWAYPIPTTITDPSDLIQTLIDFLNYCKVINIDQLKIQRGLLP